MTAAAEEVALEAPQAVGRYDVAEFVLRLDRAPQGNPFTEVKLSGEFVAEPGSALRVQGFCDAQDGRLFRLRFCPDKAGATYRYQLKLHWRGIDKQFDGELRCESSDRPGPVVVDPQHRKHFVHVGSGQPFYHLGFTAYHLLDPSNDDAQVDATIDYARRLGFNKIRFLLAGYPRDLDKRTSADPEHGVADPRQAPNYGSKPGQVNPLPAWLGDPHTYDFTRFNVGYWQRVDRAVRRLRDAGLVATCIVTLEKQDLPAEYGRLTENEYRFYAYAVARLAAFDNVWWDLGNEHNEYRDAAWANAMGAFVKEQDSYHRLCSAHGYAEFRHGASAWADFIITQQYGDEKTVHDWVLRYANVAKPYVNEEYGYEGQADKPGHGQNADWVRRCHWSIALAGGYASYGDWSGGVSYFYMGEPGPGRAASQLQHLRGFFEALPYSSMSPHDELCRTGFCLARVPDLYVFYFPRGGRGEIELGPDAAGPLQARWYDPREGQWREGPVLSGTSSRLHTPTSADWVLMVRRND